jgi:hypothetical protein
MMDSQKVHLLRYARPSSLQRSAVYTLWVLRLIPHGLQALHMERFANPFISVIRKKSICLLVSLTLARPLCSRAGNCSAITRHCSVALSQRQTFFAAKKQQHFQNNMV